VRKKSGKIPHSFGNTRLRALLKKAEVMSGRKVSRVLLIRLSGSSKTESDIDSINCQVILVKQAGKNCNKIAAVSIFKRVTLCDILSY
jgi:hypothetical protein